MHDFVKIAEGFKDGLDRWKKRGCPGTSKEHHIELCRKKIESESENDNVVINLNENLYIKNKDAIFSEGADFEDPEYVHLKIGDIRVELSIQDFEVLGDAIIEAKEKLKNRVPDPVL